MALPKITPEDRAKASNKPIPKTLQAWQAEIVGVAGFVAQKPRLKDNNGAAWLKTMQRYYLARVVVLAGSPPAGMTKKQALSSVEPVLALLK